MRCFRFCRMRGGRGGTWSSTAGRFGGLTASSGFLRHSDSEFRLSAFAVAFTKMRKRCVWNVKVNFVKLTKMRLQTWYSWIDRWIAEKNAGLVVASMYTIRMKVWKLFAAIFIPICVATAFYLRMIMKRKQCRCEMRVEKMRVVEVSSRLHLVSQLMRIKWKRVKCRFCLV